MRCPHCNTDGRHKVLETRRNSAGAYRRCKCEHCGKTYVTLETADPLFKMPAEFNGNVKRAKLAERATAIQRSAYGSKSAHLQALIMPARVTAQ